MEVNQVMSQEHCFVYWLVYASLGIFWGISWHAGWERGRGKENTKQYMWEREGGAREKNICSNLDFAFFGDLFWKSLVQADRYLCTGLPAVTLGNRMCLLQQSSEVLWDITACVIRANYRGPMKSSPEWINLTDTVLLRATSWERLKLSDRKVRTVKSWTLWKSLQQTHTCFLFLKELFSALYSFIY